MGSRTPCRCQAASTLTLLKHHGLEQRAPLALWTLGVHRKQAGCSPNTSGGRGTVRPKPLPLEGLNTADAA